MSKQRIDKKPKRLSTKARSRMFLRLASRDGRYCRLCGSINNLTIDHIMPIKDGGTSRFENLQLLCFRCNNDKDKLPRTNLKQRGTFLKNHKSVFYN